MSPKDNNEGKPAPQPLRSKPAPVTLSVKEAKPAFKATSGEKKPITTKRDGIYGENQETGLFKPRGGKSLSSQTKITQ